MRLLECTDNNGFVLTKVFDSKEAIPPYAILSHTWKDNEEVAFGEIINGTGREKEGYKKIDFCRQQAKRDGLQYFWVDTCCINKSDHVELREAINSMFRWYKNAAKCYVYLSDVSALKRKADDKLSEFTWDSAFRASRWFTRGWTLQELLAPNSVEFFSQEGRRLGDKRSLIQQIHTATRIPQVALQGAPLSQFSVNQRMSWIEHRQTKLEEDRVYSLLGIFGVYIPTIYGEGIARASKRLMDEIEKLEKCIQDLRATDPRDDKKRIENTKGGLLEDSYRWILENRDFRHWHASQQSQLLWIKGDPGKGKTMLLCGIINELKKSLPTTDLLSYFFCQATDARINNATAVLRGLLYLLVNQQPSLISYIQKKHDQAGKALFEDANAWVALSEVFTSILQDPFLGSTYLVVDALDECVNDLEKLLDFIVERSSASPRVKWIVSSRNWPEIEERLAKAEQGVRLSLELNAEFISAAVSGFIQHKVRQLAQEKKYDIKMREAVQHHLSLNADGTFLWVALVCQDLKKIPRWNVLAKLKAFPPGLDSLYKRMLDQICHSDDADLCQRILASIATVYRPIMVQELSSLIEILEDMAGDLESLQEIVGLCGSFLTLRENTVYFVHQSAKDFLLTKASTDIFPSGQGEVHRVLFTKSLRVMSVSLERDMYSLRELGRLTEQIETPQPDPLAPSRYSCIYWVDHLYDWNPISSAVHLANLQDGGSVNKFLTQKYLYWLEALSLCKGISKGVGSMAKLEGLIQRQAGTSATLQLVQDARRFVMNHKWAIESAPLQAYVSALVFSPRQSLIRSLFQHEAPPWLTIKPAMMDKWGACLQTLEGHSGPVKSVAFSHNSIRIASASNDKTVKIWDASSGDCLQTLAGHSGPVCSVAFSHDSTRIASVSDDKTVKIWDANSGDCLQTLTGHSGPVCSVAFSHDSTRIASVSDDKTVKIWDANSCDCLQTLAGHSGSVRSVAFSHDSTRIASASLDKTVKIWDASSGDCLQTLAGHSGSVWSVAFSHNSTRIASASFDKTVKIWDANSGDCLQTLAGHSGPVYSVAFSHDSTRIASASVDNTVKIWDASSGDCLQTLAGHSGPVWSVAFSHDSTRIASASVDNTVKIWDAISDCLQTLAGHSGPVYSVAFSPDSTRIASASVDKTVKIWDANSGDCLQTLAGHSGPVRSVAFSHDSTRIASASVDNTVKIWDASSDCLQTLACHSGSVWLVAFSHESTRIASASFDKTVKIWDASSGDCLQTLTGHSGSVWSVAFSQNSTRIASASVDKTVKIWDASSGDCLQTLTGHSGPVRSVAFSHDSTRIASASVDKTVKIWDASSGDCLQTLAGHSGPVGSVAFSHDSTRIASALVNNTEIGTVVIGDSTTPNRTTVVTNQSPQHQYTALSSDNTWIAYDSKRVLWLPSEYRPSSFAVSGTMIAIGVGNGKVWICDFNL